MRAPQTALPLISSNLPAPQQPAEQNSNGHHAWQPAAAVSDRNKKYVWLGDRPTCSQCGDRGHDSSSCATAYCDVCSKYGHVSGDCSSACINCGKSHKGPNCILCKQCGLFGHLLPFCHSTQCARCVDPGGGGGYNAPSYAHGWMLLTWQYAVQRPHVYAVRPTWSLQTRAPHTCLSC